MSFVTLHENLFRTGRPPISDNFNKLKNASSCTDIRAWSLDPKKRSEYFMEVVNISTCLKSDEDDDSSKSDISNKVSARKSHSVEYLFPGKEDEINSLKSLLAAANNKVGQFMLVNNKLRKKNSKCTNEVANLRSLIRDLQEQLGHLESLKVENLTLKSGMGKDLKENLSKAEDEIRHLKCEVEIFHDIKQKYEELRQAHDKIKTEYNILNSTLAMVKEEKVKLVVQCNIQKKSLDQWKTKASNMLSVITDKNLLRDKLQEKDDKIASLCESIMEQEIRIQDLNNQLNKGADEFHQMQQSLMGRIECLEFELNLKTSQVTDLETQLATSKLVVQELEALREQFRATNLDLRENVAVLRAQFQNVLNTSNHMVETIETLKRELEEKKRDLEQAKRLPHSTKTKFYLEELNRMLDSSKLGKGDTVSLTDTIMSVKSIVNCLKRDMWVAIDTSSLIIELSDSCSQTDFSKGDYSQETLCCSYAQTLHWDDYVELYSRAQEEIDQLTEYNSSLVLCTETQKTVAHSLQCKVRTTLKELEQRDTFMSELERSNKALYEHIWLLNEQLKNSDDLLNEAIAQLGVDAEIRDLSQKQIENVLSSAKIDYETYSRVLQSCLHTYTLLSKEHGPNDKFYIEMLKQEIIGLNEKLHEEKTKSSGLHGTVNSLLDEINDKSKCISNLEQKLSSVDNTLYSLIDDNTNSPNMVDFKLTMILNQYKRKLVAQVEVKDKSATFSRREVEKCLKINRAQKMKMQQKIVQMTTNMKRVKSAVMSLQSTIVKSENSIKEVQTISDQLTVENESLKKDNANLVQEVETLKLGLKTKSANLAIAEKAKNELFEMKTNLEKLIMSLMRKLAKYKKVIDKNKEVTDTRTDDEFLQLNKEIESLKIKNMTLFFEINDLKGKKSASKDNINDDDSNVTKHYETMVRNLRKEHIVEKEQLQKQQSDNLKNLQETFEREKNEIKRSHAELILRLQSLHNEQVTSMQNEVEHAKEKQEKQKRASDAEHQNEINILKRKYETLLAQKDELLAAENEMLKIRLMKVTLEKDSQLDRISSEMALNFKNFRNKCKFNVQKLKEKHKADLDRLVKMCKNEVVNAIKSEEKFAKKETKNAALSNFQTAMKNVKTHRNNEFN